jgi:ribonuclease HII
MTIGVDEVGRGSWAGPLLVVAASNHSALPQGLKDSKQLTRSQRAKIYELLLQTCTFGEGWVQPEEIDTHGLAEAMRIGVSRALVGLGANLDTEIVLDGNVNYCPAEFINTKAIINADVFYPLVSAASIYAKVKRDGYMWQIAQFYPEYEFEKHVGYGTKLHQQALETYGPSKIHRQSYEPVRKLLSVKPSELHTAKRVHKQRVYLQTEP